MVAKTPKTVGKSKQSGSSRKPRNLDLPASHAGAVKGGDVKTSDIVIAKKTDKSSSKLFQSQAYTDVAASIWLRRGRRPGARTRRPNRFRPGASMPVGRRLSREGRSRDGETSSSSVADISRSTVTATRRTKKSGKKIKTLRTKS